MVDHRIHWVGAKKLLRYLCGTIDNGMRYTVGSMTLLGYTDVDWANILVDCKRTSGCYFTRRSASGRKRKSVAFSTAETEYIAACMARCEVTWLQKLFSELFEHVLDATIILCDNQRGIRLSENPVFHDRSKHDDGWYHFIQDMVQRGAVRLDHIGTDEQVVDILTIPLGRLMLLTFHENIGIVE